VRRAQRFGRPDAFVLRRMTSKTARIAPSRRARSERSEGPGRITEPFARNAAPHGSAQRSRLSVCALRRSVAAFPRRRRARVSARPAGEMNEPRYRKGSRTGARGSPSNASKGKQTSQANVLAGWVGGGAAAAPAPAPGAAAQPAAEAVAPTASPAAAAAAAPAAAAAAAAVAGGCSFSSRMRSGLTDRRRRA